jgi:putative acetyltransferase
MSSAVDRDASDIVIAAESAEQEDVLALIAASDAYMNGLYPPESNHGSSTQTLARPDVTLLIARRNGIALGCGALVPDDRGWAEIKRMFVDERARGTGIGLRILVALEATAVDRGIRLLRLEAGTRQPEALGLYRRAGYRLIGRFGSYPEDPLSVFMEKRLV